MKKLLPLLALLFPLTALAQLPTSTHQLIVVTTPDWTDIHGTAQRYERHGEAFQKYGEPFAVVIGKSGLAWGKGIEPVQPVEGPVKREGDGKAPAGIFKLGTAFGYAASADTRLPYLPLTDSSECVDDGASAHYNELVDGTAISKDWNSSEQMRRQDDLYKNGIFIEHNTPATAGSGSCIFFHIWRSPTSPTEGCTAMNPLSIALLLQWLDPRQSPLLVQMPEAQYEQFRSSWKLPSR